MMRKSLNSSTLDRATSISSTTQINDRVSRNNASDLYRFNLASHSDFRLKLRSSGQGSNVQLLQDLNQNGMAEANEILRSTTARSARLRAKQEGNLDAPLEAGTYFIRVSANSKSASNYRLSLTSTPSAAPVPLPTPTPDNVQSLLDQVVALTNDFRRQNGLAPLTINTRLNAAAQKHSENMALQDFFGHTGKDGSSASDRMTAAGYTWSMAAENIAAGYANATDVVQGWINSPGHRANLLNANLQEIGVGYYFLANDTGNQNWNHYWTQNFGTSR